MARMNKKGVSELISVVLLIVLAVTLSFFVFRWISGNVSEQGEKGADRATATDLCREEIRMRVNNVQDNGDFYIVTVEKLKEQGNLFQDLKLEILKLRSQVLYLV